jgi:hypothetical protein
MAGSMVFPIELRKRTIVLKQEKELEDWLNTFVEEGYSMADKHMRTIVPYSCYQALKNEKEDEDRLVILFKDNFLFSENDFLDNIPLESVRRKRRLKTAPWYP